MGYATSSVEIPGGSLDSPNGRMGGSSGGAGPTPPRAVGRNVPLLLFDIDRNGRLLCALEGDRNQLRAARPDCWSIHDVVPRGPRARDLRRPELRAVQGTETGGLTLGDITLIDLATAFLMLVTPGCAQVPPPVRDAYERRTGRESYFTFLSSRSTPF